MLRSWSERETAHPNYSGEGREKKNTKALELFKPVIFYLPFPAYEHHDQYILVYHQALNRRELITYILVIDALILKFIFGIKLYMSWTRLLSIIWSFHCTHRNGVCHTCLLTARKLSANLYDIYYCCVYSEKLLMMDRGTARDM